MNRKLCLLFLVCLAVVLVKSESSIEIDENGDEYEVKRFNIQGRQLNEGRSQCVVTRRRRSTATAVKPLESEEKSYGVDDDAVADGQAYQAFLMYSPSALNYGGDADDEEKDDEGEDNMTINANRIQGQAINVNENEDDDENIVDTEDEEDGGVLEEVGAETIELIQLPQLPVLGQLQSDGQSVAAIASASDIGNEHVSVSRVGAGHVSVKKRGHSSNSNDITVFQSLAPPKVNSQTHAVFELLQVNPEADYENDSENGANADFEFHEEVSPVTTTAVWSTGDDNLDDLYNDLDNKPLKPNKAIRKKPNNKPIKVNKRINANKRPIKRPLRPMHKNKKKTNNKNKRIGGNKKRPVNNRKPHNGNGVRRRRPLNKRKTNQMRKGNKKRRRGPAGLGPQRIVKRTRPTVQKYENTNRRASSNNKNIAKRRRNKNNAVKADKGTTHTMTTTQTGAPDDDADVNCIFIRKDPPPTTTTTTPRPFWNILGRRANGISAAAGQYGHRKRVNFRLVA